MINRFDCKPGNYVFLASFGHILTEEEFTDFKAQNYSGVPITKEELEKNGFDYLDQSSVCMLECNDEKYFYEFINGCFRLVDTKTRRTILLPEIEYVHQLQNLFQMLEKKPLKWKA